MTRDHINDFVMPALKGLSPLQQKRIGLALDCAVAFGALEAQDGNQSLKAGHTLTSAYTEKCARLQSGRY